MSILKLSHKDAMIHCIKDVVLIDFLNAFSFDIKSQKYYVEFQLFQTIINNRKMLRFFTFLNKKNVIPSHLIVDFKSFKKEFQHRYYLDEKIKSSKFSSHFSVYHYPILSKIYDNLDFSHLNENDLIEICIVLIKILGTVKPDNYLSIAPNYDMEDTLLHIKTKKLYEASNLGTYGKNKRQYYELTDVENTFDKPTIQKIPDFY